MGCAASLAAPSLVLHLQPLRKTFLPNSFHIPNNTLSVRILRIRNELLHEFTALQFAAFNAKFITFALRTSLDATRGAISGGFYAFAPAALLSLINYSGFGRQQDRASATIDAAISMQDKIHKVSSS
jgi:hypothetical protein